LPAEKTEDRKQAFEKGREPNFFEATKLPDIYFFLII